jgi:hypothetical protein
LSEGDLEIPMDMESIED